LLRLTEWNVSESRATEAMRLLRANAFLITNVHVRPGVVEYQGTRFDELGTEIPYVIAVVEEDLDGAAAESLKRSASARGAALLLVSASAEHIQDAISWPTFVARLGGGLPSTLPLEEFYGEELAALGRGQRPTRLVDGEIDDLYESHVHAGLEFLVGSRVVRYGRKRAFVPVADGLVIPIREDGVFLYDAKSASNGFEVERDDIRRFADYVERYDERWRQFTGPVRSFLVISTAFSGDDERRREASVQLQADAGVPMSFMRSHDLSAAVAIFRDAPWARGVVSWREVFSAVDVTVDRVQRQLNSARDDKVIAR
jgi:hypothetical protein